MLCLVDDVLFRILDDLGLAVAVKLRLVSKEWKTFIDKYLTYAPAAVVSGSKVHESSMETLVNKCPRLRSLSLRACDQVSSLTTIASLTNLQSLSVVFCSISDINPISCLKSLVSLDLSRCSGVHSIAAVAGCRKLRCLLLSLLGSLKDISPVSELKELRILDLSFCVAITDFSPIKSLSRLYRLGLNGCNIVTNDFLSGLVELKELDMCRLSSPIENIPFLPKLTLLNISESSIENISRISVPSLEYLMAQACRSPNNFWGLCALENMTNLNLSSTDIRDLSMLQHLTRLRSLTLRHCGQVTDITPISKLPSLRHLCLASCDMLANILPLASLGNLTSLDVSDCSLIRSFAMGGSSLAASLLELDARGCPICTLDSLTCFSALESILLGPAVIDSIEPLAKIPSLQKIRIENCPRVTSIEALKTLPRLKSVQILDSPDVTDVMSLLKGSSLSFLRVVRCGYSASKQLREASRSFSQATGPIILTQ